MSIIRPKKIRILFIIDVLLGFAGTEKHLYDMVANLDRNIFSCFIVAFHARQSTIDEFEKIGITVMLLPLKKIYGFRAMRQLFALIKYIREITPDIVQTFHLKADTFGVLAAKIAGVSTVVSSRRDTGELKKTQHILLHRIINFFIIRFIAVCHSVAEEIQAKEHIPGNSIRVIHNGVDIHKYHPLFRNSSEARVEIGIPDDAFVVGIVSNFRPEKDLLTFFRAMSILKKDIRNLFIIASGRGRSPQQQEVGRKIDAFCEENNLSSITVIPGYVKDVRTYIAAMDVACLTPIRNEGLSNAILEKMSMGKPVVATDNGGNKEMVMHGKTGFIVPPGDCEALADRIQYLYINPGQRKLMGKESRKRIEQYFDIKYMIEKHEDFYKELLHCR